MEKKSNTADLDELKAKIKKELYQQLKAEVKKELLQEIYQDLRKEEELTVDLEKVSEKIEQDNEVHSDEKPDSKPIKTPKTKEQIEITVKAFLKIATHAKKYANKKIPRDRWVEVIGLLAGKYDEAADLLVIEDAYPMGHGTAVYAEIKDYTNFTRAFQDLKAKDLFICGWYHSHPSYGLFLSGEDIGTQSRYQKLWNKSVALVIDPYQIDGTSYGFKMFRANLKTQKWFELPFVMKGELKMNVLPDLLEFINPVVDGKALFLEYDTMNG
jgi:proteasome lid subunit RPN8/RPN11